MVTPLSNRIHWLRMRPVTNITQFRSLFHGLLRLFSCETRDSLAEILGLDCTVLYLLWAFLLVYTHIIARVFRIFCGFDILIWSFSIQIQNKKCHFRNTKKIHSDLLSVRKRLSQITFMQIQPRIFLSGITSINWAFSANRY